MFFYVSSDFNPSHTLGVTEFLVMFKYDLQVQKELGIFSIYFLFLAVCRTLSALQTMI